MTRAIVYEKRDFWLATFTLIFVAVLIFFLRSSTLVAVLLILTFYLALRIPLIVLAKNVKVVEVEGIVEVKTGSYECLKALLRYSKLFLTTFVLLLLLTFVALLLNPFYAIFPLNFFLVTIASSSAESSRIVVCREGIVDGRGVLNLWEDLRGCEVRGSWILVKKRLGFPIVIPKDGKVERVLFSYLTLRVKI